MIKLLKALAAALVLVTLVAGIPLALLTFYGSPIPQQLPSVDDVAHLFTSNDSIGFLLFVLVWMGWIAWATFALSVVIEIIARVRHLPTPQIRGLSAQQGAAALLVAAIAGLSAPAAMAETPAEVAPVTSTVQMEAPAVPTEQPQADTTQQDAAAEAPASDLVVTVQPGDTAWDLAETHLGAGSKWRAIVEANDGRIQPDGGALHVGQDPYLEPGWTLVMPGVPASTPEAPAQAAETPPQTVTVERGQTLSSIAQHHLGDEDRWPEIFDASKDIAQPGGYHLEDPDQIDIGWTLRVPGTVTEAPAAPAAEDATPAESVPVQEPAAAPASAEAAPVDAAPVDAAPVDAAPVAEAGTAAPSTAPAQPTAEATTPAPSAEAEQSHAVPWAGVGSIFAASILGAVLARRLYTQRKRRADQKIPTAAAIDLDQVRLARIEDPTVLGFIDRALRTLSALQLRDDRDLPDIRLARVTDTHLELYAATPHRLPAPFEATEDPATWMLPRTAPLADDQTIGDIIAPYPALVTIGTDRDGHQILVDLEHLAALGIHAQSSTSIPVMRALTVSLATSQWADDLSITTVGVCPELEDALGSGRITYRETVAELLEGLEAKLARDQEALTELGHDSAQHARQAGDATDLWAPEIIIIGTDLSLTETRRLQLIVDARPQIAVAVISSDQHTDLSEWRLHIESLEASRLEPLGLEIAPQHLTDADYDAVLRALGAASALEPADDAADAQEDAEGPHEEPLLRPVPIPRPTTHEILTATQRDTPAEIPTDHPYIRLLGPVEILGATGTLEAKRLAALTEAACYIYLQPGTPETDFRADLWPGKPVADSTRHQLISRTRKWLDAAPDGTRYLLHANNTDGSYSLSEHVTSDWDLVQDVATNRKTAAAEDLADALKLVRGAPFENGGRTRYRWAISLTYTMTDTVLDLAQELAHRALEAGDLETTLWATEHGLLVESLHEQLWRYRLQAAAHDPELHQRITHDLETQLAAVDDGYDLMPETEALMYPAPTPHRIAI